MTYHFIPEIATKFFEVPTPSLETSIFPLSFQVVKEPLPFAPFILRKDITQFIRILNSRLFSFLETSKSSKFNSLIGTLPDYHASSVDRTNLVFTIPLDLYLYDSERSVLAKGLKFVRNSGSLDLFSVKANNESFFRRLRLKAHFHNQPSTRTFLRLSALVSTR